MEESKIAENVAKTTEKVFESMVFMKVNGANFDENIKIPSKHLTAMVGFAGAYVGLAAIHCTETFARIIGGSMLMMDQDKLSNEDVRDALGEIANMIAGHFKARLAESLQTQEQVFEQSVPSVISGDDYETYAVTDAPKYTVEFDTDHEKFWVELALKKT